MLMNSNLVRYLESRALRYHHKGAVKQLRIELLRMNICQTVIRLLFEMKERISVEIMKHKISVYAIYYPTSQNIIQQIIWNSFIDS